MAFTTEYIPIQINHTNLYRIPRMAMNTYGGYYENLSKILGIWQDILKNEAIDKHSESQVFGRWCC